MLGLFKNDLFFRLTAMLTIITFFTTGCASLAMKSKYGDESNYCYQQRMSLIGVQEEFEADIMKTALKGALVGAATGAATAAVYSITKGGGVNVKDVAIGAAAGFVFGAAAGYLKAKMDQTKSKEALYLTIAEDINKDVGLTKGVPKMIDDLRLCRIKQVDALVSTIKQNKITKKDAIETKNKIKDSINLDKELVVELVGEMNTKFDNYALASVDAVRLTDNEFKPQKKEPVKSSNTMPNIPTSVANVSSLFGGATVNKSDNQQSSKAAEESYKPQVVVKNVNFRESASKNGKLIKKLIPGDEILVAESSFNNAWRKIKLNDINGFVYKGATVDIDSNEAKKAVANKKNTGKKELTGTSLELPNKNMSKVQGEVKLALDNLSVMSDSVDDDIETLMRTNSFMKMYAKYLFDRVLS